MSPQDIGGREEKWDDVLARATQSVEEMEAAAAEARARRRTRRGAWLLPISVVALLAVGGWNARLLTRPPSLPPLADQAYALRRSAAAVVEEVVAIRETERRWPSASELADLLEEGLTIREVDGGVVATYSDGEILVRYDGSVPLDTWVVSGGFELVQREGA